MKIKYYIVLFLVLIPCFGFGQTRPSYLQLKDAPYTDIVDISLYGASPLATTSTNDAAFSAAIAKLTAKGGGILYIPDGVFEISDAITIPAGTSVIVQGAGQFNSVIRVKGSIGMDVASSFSEGSGFFVIRDVRFYGDGDTSAQTALKVGGVFHSSWSNVSFVHIGEAIDLTICYYLTMDGFVFQEVGEAFDCHSGVIELNLRGCSTQNSRVSFEGASSVYLDTCGFEGDPEVDDGRAVVVLTDRCTMSNCYLERLNLYDPPSRPTANIRPWVQILGDNNRVVNQIVQVNGPEMVARNASSSIYLIEGDNNEVEIGQATNMNHSLVLFGSTATGNTILFKNRMQDLEFGAPTYSGKYNAIWYNAKPQNYIFDIDGVRSEFYGFASNVMGNTADAGSLNTCMTSANIGGVSGWIRQECTVASLSPLLYPHGYTAITHDSLFATVEVASSTGNRRLIYLFDHALNFTATTTVSLTALVYVPTANTSYLRSNLYPGGGVVVFPSDSWVRINLREQFSPGATITPSFEMPLGVASDTFSVGCVGITISEVPAFCGVSTASPTARARYEFP